MQLKAINRLCTVKRCMNLHCMILTLLHANIFQHYAIIFMILMILTITLFTLTSDLLNFKKVIVHSIALQCRDAIKSTDKQFY